MLSELQDSLTKSLSEIVDSRFDSNNSTTSQPTPLLTVDDVARYLSVSKRTVETLISDGELVPLRIRSARRFAKDAVDSYLRSVARQQAN